ncbi:hypothetical protein [Streptomyces sp. NPDC048385]
MRTGVPLVAGWLLTLAVKAGITIDSGNISALVTVALALAYYLAFRVLELVGNRLRGSVLQSVAGLALGWARPPSYPKVDALPPVTGTYTRTTS